LAPGFEAFDAFGAFGVCACADIEPVKITNAKATMKNDFITSPKVWFKPRSAVWCHDGLLGLPATIAPITLTRPLADLNWARRG
jgi:hypothetical protein